MHRLDIQEQMSQISQWRALILEGNTGVLGRRLDSLGMMPLDNAGSSPMTDSHQSRMKLDITNPYSPTTVLSLTGR